MNDKRVTRVRIERADGTYIELTDPDGCERWRQMAEGQAAVAAVHGAEYGPLPWQEGVLTGQPDAAVTARELIDEFVKWCANDDLRLCERAFGEYRKIDKADVDTAIKDFVAAHLKQ